MCTVEKAVCASTNERDRKVHSLYSEVDYENPKGFAS
jgi:hypothetical protein